MTDRERHAVDGRLQAEYAQARADHSRKRQEARELGEYLRDFGQALIDRPEHIAVPQESTIAYEDWFLPHRDLPRMEDISALVAELRELSVKVKNRADDLKSRGLPM